MINKSYTMTELQAESGVPVPTIRSYFMNGLLDPPVNRGPKTRYTEDHLERLKAIQRLKLLGKSRHAEIRQWLCAMSPADILRLEPDSFRTEERAEELGAHSVSVAPTDHPLDYLRRLRATKNLRESVDRTRIPKAVDLKCLVEELRVMTREKSGSTQETASLSHWVEVEVLANLRLAIRGNFDATDEKRLSLLGRHLRRAIEDAVSPEGTGNTKEP
jgi:DNA-binding transcriptional MerR regulator